jgi:hypothetical protein
MLSESDFFYYVALAIVFFIILYIIYISLHFQNDLIESFSLGGGKKDKKEKKTKEEKLAELLEEQNIVLEDALKIKENKDAYINILKEIRRKAHLERLKDLEKDDDFSKNTRGMLKFNLESIDMLISFVENE